MTNADNSDRFTGDPIISIDPGIDITIPNHELVRSFVDINATTGQEYIPDNSKRVMGLYAEDSQTANSMLALGRTFLTGAYLMVDADKQQFTIWKGQSSTEQKLVAHGPPLCPDTASAASPNSAVASSSKGSTLAISKGAIVGISVALFFVLLIGVGAVYTLVRRRSTAQAQLDEHASLGSDDSPFQKAELSSDQYYQAPQEMSTGKHASGALAPYEVNGSRDLAAEMAAPRKVVEMAANEDSAFEK